MLLDFAIGIFLAILTLIIAETAFRVTRWLLCWIADKLNIT